MSQSLFQNQHALCPYKKTLLTLLVTLSSMAAVFWALGRNPSPRVMILLLCTGVYWFRFMITTWVFMQRRLSWGETAGVTLLIVLIINLLLLAGTLKAHPLDLWDIPALFLYMTGSIINTASESARHQWKRNQPSEALYTEGWFGLSRHINYFGEVVLFIGWSWLTRMPITLFVPLSMSLNFIAILIPAKETYMAAKYGPAFRAYASRTRKFVPWVY